MAAYYFSISKNEEHSRIIADYIVNYAKENPQKDWKIVKSEVEQLPFF